MPKRCPAGTKKKGNKCVSKQKPNWIKDGKQFSTEYKGFQATVYKVKDRFEEAGVESNIEGYEYELYREHPSAEYDSLSESSMGGDHAETPEEAMEWAERTIDEWED